MSEIEENTSLLDLDPVEQLEETKRKIQGEVAAAKELVKNAKKKYRDYEKLKLEDHPDKPEKLKTQQAEIEKYQQVLFEHEADFKELNRTKDDETEEKVQGALNKVAQDYVDCDPTAAYVIADDEFVFITDYSSVAEKQNVQIRTMPPRQFIQLLANDLNLKAWHLPAHRLIDLFNNKNRTFQLKRYSIDPSLWQGNKIYLPIRHMEQYFIDRIDIPADQESFVTQGLEYFDWLMYSLSGGKQENQQHIEQWILHKIINYKKAVTTPDLVVVGHVGGNGKGIIQAIVRLMLPAVLSGKANSKTLNGNFNAIMLGKLIVFFDDQNSKEIPLEVVKQLAGSETMIFEPKGKDQYEGEKTHSSAWFSNKLPFKLTPAGHEGGVDRRFSITRTNITFLESIRHHIALKGHEVSVEQSKDFAEEIVSKYLLNRLCIGAWFKALQDKHPEVDRTFTLKPLHGGDYHYFLDQQQDSLDSIFRELIVPVVSSGGCVPVFVIKELMRHIDGYISKDKTIHTRINELASQYKLDIVSEKTHIYITSGPSISTRKQCTVIHPIGIKNWTDKTFDWGLVSNTAYVGSVAAGHDLIKEDELVFGVKGDVDDEDIVDDDSGDDTDEPSENIWSRLN
jgi:hypothetical protein